MIMTKLRRSTRGLSPIFATLILIAIAVIAGIIVYMFTSGTLAAMMGGGTAGQEKVNIQAISGVSSSGAITLYAQSTGGGDVVLDSAIIKDSAGNVIFVDVGPTGGPIKPDLTTISVAAGTGKLTAGHTYTVTLVSTAGGSFVSPSFKAT